MQTTSSCPARNTVIDATVVRPPLTGVHYAVRHEAMALARRLGPGCVCLAADPETRQQAGDAGASLPPLPSGLHRVARRIIWQQLQLPRLLRRHDAGCLLALAYTAPQRCPSPYLLQIHDTIALRRPELCSRLNALHMRLLMPGSIRRARYLITSSASVSDELVALSGVPRDRVHSVPLGIDPLFLEANTPPLPIDWQARQPYILFVGTIEPKKGLTTLLEAYARIAARAGVGLVLAGRTGWKCGALLRAVDGYSGPSAVYRAGYVPRELLPALYRGAAACVMPSEEEGFGLPVLEAMACGAPVVHSDHPVLQETAGGHGLSFARSDSEALAEQLLRLLEDSDLQAEMRERGQQWAAKHSWDNWARAVLEITGAATVSVAATTGA